MAESLFIPKEDSDVYQDILKTNKLLINELTKRITQYNTFTIQEFDKFKILFSTDIREYFPDDKLKKGVDDLPESIKELTHEFYRRIDPFREIRIVDENDEVLFLFPPVFISPNKIVSTDKNLSTIEKVHNKTILQNPREYLKSISSYYNEFLSHQFTENHKQHILKCREIFLKANEAIKSPVEPDEDEKDITLDDIEEIGWD